MPPSDTKTLLVPTDFSSSAQKALDFGVMMAKKTQSKILILHIYLIPIIPVRGALFTETEKGKINLAIAERRLRNLVKRTAGLSDIEYETKASPMYGPIEVPDIIKFQSADIIIMGFHKTGTLARWIMGTNTALVIENAVCPVLAIPDEADCSSVEKIGVAYDGLPIDDMARLDFLLQFADAFNARIDIIHFKSKENVSSSELPENHLVRLREYIGDFLNEFCEIEEQSMEEGINQTIEEKQIDILTMLPHSKSLLTKIFKGSMTRKMIFKVKTGLLVLPELKG